MATTNFAKKLKSYSRIHPQAAAKSIVLPIVGIAVLFFLATFQQPYLPVAWTDEGFVIQGAMNLVRHGQYALLSSEGFRVLDQPLVANGPGIVLPVAAVFSLFGVGLEQARLAAEIFFILTAISFFLLARRLFSTSAALLSTLMLLTFPGEGFIWFGRMSLGNIPALAYLLIGYLAWLKFVENEERAYAFIAGLLFGLALITKSQSIVFIAAMFITALLDLFSYRMVGFKKFTSVLFIPLLMLAAWFVAQVLIVGLEDIDRHFAAVSSSSRVTILVFSLERLPRNIWHLVTTGMPFITTPPLLYAAWLCRSRSQKSITLLPLVIFAILWFSWYVVASIGWQRYLLEGFVVSALFSGKFLVDVFKYLTIEHNPFPGWLGGAARWSAAVLAGLVIAGMLWGLVWQYRFLATKPDRSIQQFAAYLEANVPDAAVIESWEWSLDPLVRRSFHHPTNDWVNRMTMVLTLGETLEKPYDLSLYQPDYLIDGPFSQDTQLYRPELEAGCCTLIHSLPPYNLYRVDR